MKLIEHLPTDQYNNEPHVVELQEAIGTEINSTWDKVEDFILQMNPSTATWGLEFFEQEYGIKTDTKKTLEQRREFLFAKMKGKGTSTVALIKEVANSFSNGEVDVTEHFSDYWFELVFTSHIGVPERIEDLLAVIEEIKPAHLGLNYIETYNTHAYLAQFTHRFLAQFTHKEVRTKKLDEEWREWQKTH